MKEHEGYPMNTTIDNGKIMMMKDILKLINKVDDIEQKIINLDAREKHSTREIMLMIETITSERKEQSNASKKEKSV
tara:strand:- start:190 stop:420 length:231 start_codon:yes stop_codon:yes gene_type:complete